MIVASELKEGMVVRIQGQVYKVLEAESRAGVAKLSGVVKAKLRNLVSGRLWEPHFRPGENLEDLETEQHAMEFLFDSGESSVFMNPDNFEQMEVPRMFLGPVHRFLQPGMQLQVEFFDGRPISVTFPDVVEVCVASTSPASHSQQDSAWKEATLENGLPIRVPLFIAPGEIVRVDVKSGRYIERVRADRKRSA